MTILVDQMAVLLWPLMFLIAVVLLAMNALTSRDDVSVAVTALKLAPVNRKASSTNVFRRRPVKRAIRSIHKSSRSTLHGPKIAKGGNRSFATTITNLALALLAAGAIEVATVPAAGAASFVFDPRRTEVRFAYTMAYATQRGRFTKVHGTLDYDAAAPEKSKVKAAIAAASLTTGEAIVDNELKGESFFNVEASPVIAFKSLDVRPKSATTAHVAGEITINGITKPVTLHVSLKPHDDPALKYDAGAHQFIATTRIKRSAFRMTKYQSLVDDNVDLEIAAIVRPK